MEDDGQKSADAEESPARFRMRFRCDGSAEGQAIDNRVERQAKRQAEPAKAVPRRCWFLRWAGSADLHQRRSIGAGSLGGGVMLVMVIVTTVGMVVGMIMPRPFAVLMGVNMEDADEQEHEEQAAQSPECRLIERALFGNGVGEQVQQRHPKHQSTDKTHHQLHPAMGQLH